MIEKLRELMEEFKRIDGCSPLTPWSGCKAQEYSNIDHYYCHPDAKRKILNQVYQILDIPRRYDRKKIKRI